MLVLGSLPSPKSRETGFYYGHPQNRFWRVLADVLGEHAFGYFLDNKHQEWEEYNQQVTPYELKKYLPKL